MPRVSGTVKGSEKVRDMMPLFTTQLIQSQGYTVQLLIVVVISNLLVNPSEVCYVLWVGEHAPLAHEVLQKHDPCTSEAGSSCDGEKRATWGFSKTKSFQRGKPPELYLQPGGWRSARKERLGWAGIWGEPDRRPEVGPGQGWPQAWRVLNVQAKERPLTRCQLSAGRWDALNSPAR